MKGASRLDAIVATFVGVLALGVSGYTAYIQRQQVRAQVWPYLEVGYSNVPTLRMTLVNKGAGPAIVKNVIIRVDGDHPMAPNCGDEGSFPVYPFALTNPIFLDTDGNGAYDPVLPHGAHEPKGSAQ